MTGVIAILVTVILGLSFSWGVSVMRQRQDPNDKAQRERQTALRKAVEAGTHNDMGEPLCRVCGSNSDENSIATERAFRIERDEGFAAWIRQRIGAPARLATGRDLDGELAYCRVHAELAHAELRSYLLAFEQTRVDQVRDAEVELGRFERTGLDERVKARVAEHERRVRKEGSVPAQKTNVIALGSR